jgi:protein-S-isoprenylcysteine O-methyltransferase Ste14
VFLPFTVLRARLEEASLRDKHGPEWEEYAGRTHFLIPLIF